MTARFLFVAIPEKEKCFNRPNVDIYAAESPFVVQKHLANIIAAKILHFLGFFIRCHLIFMLYVIILTMKIFKWLHQVSIPEMLTWKIIIAVSKVFFHRTSFQMMPSFENIILQLETDVLIYWTYEKDPHKEINLSFIFFWNMVIWKGSFLDEH